MKHRSDRGDSDEQALSERPARMTGVVARTRMAQVVSLDEARANGLVPAWEVVEGYLHSRRNAERIEAWEQRSPAFAGVLRVLRGLDVVNGSSPEAPERRPLSGSDRAPSWLLRPRCEREA